MPIIEQMKSEDLRNELPELDSNIIFTNENQSPFSEYGVISNEQLKSADFREKYENFLIVDGGVVSSGSTIMKELAAKMGKSAKAAHLMVKRTFIQPSASEKKNLKIGSRSEDVKKAVC